MPGLVKESQHQNLNTTQTSHTNRHSNHFSLTSHFGSEVGPERVWNLAFRTKALGAQLLVNELGTGNANSILP